MTTSKPYIRPAESQDRNFLATRFMKALEDGAGLHPKVVKDIGPHLYDRIAAKADEYVVCVGDDGTDRNTLLGCAIALQGMLLAIDIISALRETTTLPKLLLRTTGASEYVPTIFDPPGWLRPALKAYPTITVLDPNPQLMRLLALL